MHIHPRLYEKLAAGAQPRYPVILYYRRPREDVRRCILQRYGPIKYELPFIGAMAMDLPANKLALIAREPMVQWVVDDVAVSKVESAPSQSFRTPAPPLVDSYFDPFEGFRSPALSGPRSIVDSYQPPISAAIIDTGIAPHRDLLSPVNRIRAFYDLVGHKSEPYDDDGHGTHIAGILCGLASAGPVYGHAQTWPDTGPHFSGNRSHSSPHFPTGPAIVAVKALDHEGNGNASDILAAMQWVLNNSRFYNIRVVNLSLGVAAEEDPAADPLVRGVEALTRYGLTVVAAAGNSGPDPSTISSPGISRHAITVGAAEGDHIASFSSRGPTPQGLIKPDLVAPGVNILSLDAGAAKSQVSNAAAGMPQGISAARSAPAGYIKHSGTSMAAPFVSRAVAAEYAKHPRLDPISMKRRILQKTILLPEEPPTAQGYGLLWE